MAPVRKTVLRKFGLSSDDVKKLVEGWPFVRDPTGTFMFFISTVGDEYQVWVGADFIWELVNVWEVFGNHRLPLTTTEIKKIIGN